jgi:hypothetical protein
MDASNIENPKNALYFSGAPWLGQWGMRHAATKIFAKGQRKVH